MSKLRDAIYGFAIGDALGVPYEFKSFGSFTCEGMVGFGTHFQKKGTFSDDTSMTLATADSIRATGTVDPDDIMKRFLSWLNEGKYSPDGEVFDIGNTTFRALSLYDGTTPFCGGRNESDNGNGSLMRVLPLAFVRDVTDEQIAAVSSLTHAHEMSIDYCIRYVRLAEALIRGEDVTFPYEEPVRATGFVRDTFNAVMYSLATTASYRECVLKAVNLGDDTDTVAAIAGGLAGIKYGFEAIPEDWLDALRGKEIIEACLFK